MRFFCLLAALLAIGFAVIDAFDLSARVSLATARRAVAAPPKGMEQRDVLQLVRRASDRRLALPESRGLLADLLFDRAQNTSSEDERRSYFCESLSNLGIGLRSDPFDPHLLIRWANLRQMLGATECDRELTQGNFEEALHLALDIGKSDTVTRYTAALVFLWGGQEDKAFSLLKEALTFGTDLSSAERDFAFGLIVDEKSLRSILPARFPQVGLYVDYLDRSDRGIPESAMNALAEVQKQAIEMSVKELEADKIETKLHFERLSSLRTRFASEEVRRVLDQKTAEILEGQGEREAADYLRERSKLAQLSIVPAARAGDTRVQKAPLSDWGREEFVYMDEFFRSVGFYSPDRQAVRLIELSAMKPPSQLLKTSLRVFSSEDNQQWSDITERVKHEVIQVGGQFVIALRVPVSSAHFWKVHYASADKGKSFGAPSDRLMRVYGLKS